MKFARIFSSTALALAALGGFAQEAPKPAQAQQPSVAAPMSSAQCAAIRRARHDHGLEKNQGPMPIKGCDSTSVASAEAKPATGHDHGKFHKNQ
jgi:hypothetical protein